MKRLLLLVCAASALAGPAELAGVHNVYLLPMGKGFDQYLANHLTNSRVFQVVTDPKLADAILTDRIGEAFQQQLETISPKEEPAPPAETAKPKENAPKGNEAAEEPKGPALMTDTVNKLDNPALHSSFTSGKGNIFLVDAKSRQVLWSVFEPARGSTVKDLDRTASDIVSRLRKDLNPKK